MESLKGKREDPNLAKTGDDGCDISLQTVPLLAASQKPWDLGMFTLERAFPTLLSKTLMRSNKTDLKFLFLEFLFNLLFFFFFCVDAT